MGNRFRSLIMFVVMAVGACTCTPPKPVTPVTDGPATLPADAEPNDPPAGFDQPAWVALDPAEQACSILKTLKCSEIKYETCAADVRKLVDLGTWDQTQLLCVRQSRTLARVRTCMVDCIQK